MQQRKTLGRLLTVASFGVAAAVQAQNARVQVIHNCADAAAEVVDVYVNGGASPFIDDFTFRTATSFTDVPAGVDLTIGIAPGNSTGPDDIIPGLEFTVNLADGSTYILVASGIVSPSGYNPSPAFELKAFDLGRETASTPTNTDFLVFHGSTDAPTVQVAETAVVGAVVVNPFSYGEFTPDYVEVPTNDYVLEVQLPDGSPVVAYEAPLQTLGLQGAAFVAVASGFLDPSANSNGPSFGIWVALPSGGDLVELPLAQGDPISRIQVIHNCADAAASVVDVYVNGGATPFINDLTFRSATEFVDVPAGVDLEIGIAPGNSTGPADIIPGLTFTYNLVEGSTYVLVANGIVSGSGYTPNEPFELTVFAEGREGAVSPSNTDILVIHGSTDAPEVQVAETAVTGGAVIVAPFSYGEFSPAYLEVPTDDYVLEVQLPDGTPVAAYAAPLAALNLDGAALVAVASGFLNPSANSDGPAFGIWVALPSGGDLIELPLIEPDPTARLQVIHNCADAAASVVDVYVNGSADPFINDFEFRTATPFVDVPAGVDLVVGIAPGTSTGPDDIIPGLEFTFNLADGGTYVLVANGIVSPTGYNPTPAFELSAFTDGLETSPAGTTSVLVMHGSTDAPTVDVAELQLLDGATIVDDLAYGTFAGYLEVTTADYAVQVQTSTGAPVATYSAPLSTLGLDGLALTVVASGFLDPSNNSNGPAFGLWVALPSGGGLVELPLITNVGIGEADAALTVAAWPNPVNDILNVSVEAAEQREVTALMTDMTGRVVLEIPTTLMNRGENRLQINTTGLSNGMYTLSLVGNSGKQVMAVQVSR